MTTTPLTIELRLTCPHCGQDNPLNAAFCEACGKALPTQSKGPRIIEGASLANTTGGQKLQSDELAMKARSGSGALLAVAILSTLGVALVAFVVTDVWNDPEIGGTARTMLVSQIVLTFAYWALWVWSRQRPLPAAIVGLALLLMLFVANAIAFGPFALMQGMLLNLVIGMVLVRAIRAGMQHQDLQQKMGKRPSHV